MKRRGKSSFPSKYVLLLLTVICIMLLFAGYATGYAGEPIRTICNYVFVPMQKGLDYVGESISINSDDTKTKEQLIAENEQLTGADRRTFHTTDQYQIAAIRTGYFAGVI